jgi:phosphate acyltransferase
MDIGIDLMGSDCSPLELFLAVQCIAREYGSSVNITVYLDQSAYHLIKNHIPKKDPIANIHFQIVTDVITMSDAPLSALKKEDSPQILGMKALSAKKLQAFVSAGNTGALYVCAKRHLTLKPHLSRPFLMVSLPVADKHVVICDVGANMSCKADHLIQFSEEAVNFYRTVYEDVPPSVALLNVGIEAMKGTQEHRIAYQKLAELSTKKPQRFNFLGNVEGRGVFQGKVDIVITDGFTGNVLLKTMEGTAEYVFNRIFTLLGDSPLTDKLKEIRPQFHYAEFSGAILAGVDGLVIKCHGDASEASMYNGIKGAIQLLQS